MFKTEVSYENFDGKKVVEALRFNLSETEMLDLTKADPTFTQENLERIIKEEDAREMFDVIRKLIAVSYGVMSQDGRSFRKKEDDVYDFLCSGAYDALIDKIFTEGNDTFMTEFIIGVFPAKFADSIREGIEKQKKTNGLSVV